MTNVSELTTAWSSGWNEGRKSFAVPNGVMISAGHRVMQHGLATPVDIWDAMYRAAMGEPLESIEPKAKP